MIKINLLGKKDTATGAVPFGLDEKFSKLGFSGEEFKNSSPALIRLGVLLGGLYLASSLPIYFFEQKKKQLDEELVGLNSQVSVLNKELVAKKDIRKQMEQLNKEEAELQRQLNAVNGLQKDRSLAFRTLDNMIISLPAKVWFDSLAYKDRAVTLKGACWEYFPINDFVKSINESTQYTNVNFKGIQSESAGALIPGIPEAMQKIKNFELEFRVKTSGET